MTTSEGPNVDLGSPDGGGRWSEPSILAWSDRIRTEAARCQRYGRPASIIEMRLDGLDELAADAGSAVRDWLRGVASENLRTGARSTDVVQDDGHGSFRVLLVETDEAGARSYVERVSRLLVPWPENPASKVRLTAGWAATGSEPDLQAAERLAQARQNGASEGWIRSTAAWRS